MEQPRIGVYSEEDFEGARALLLMRYKRDEQVVGTILAQHEDEEIARAQAVARRRRQAEREEREEQEARASGTRTPTTEDQLIQQEIERALGVQRDLHAED